MRSIRAQGSAAIAACVVIRHRAGRRARQQNSVELVVRHGHDGGHRIPFRSHEILRGQRHLRNDTDHQQQRQVAERIGECVPTESDTKKADAEPFSVDGDATATADEHDERQHDEHHAAKRDGHAVTHNDEQERRLLAQNITVG